MMLPISLKLKFVLFHYLILTAEIYYPRYHRPQLLCNRTSAKRKYQSIAHLRFTVAIPHSVLVGPKFCRVSFNTNIIHYWGSGRSNSPAVEPQHRNIVHGLAEGSAFATKYTQFPRWAESKFSMREFIVNLLYLRIDLAKKLTGILFSKGCVLVSIINSR